MSKKWNWIRVLPPLPWDFEQESLEEGSAACAVSGHWGWDDMDEPVDAVKNQLDLANIGHDMDVGRATFSFDEHTRRRLGACSSARRPHQPPRSSRVAASRPESPEKLPLNRRL